MCMIFCGLEIITDLVMSSMPFLHVIFTAKGQKETSLLAAQLRSLERMKQTKKLNRGFQMTAVGDPVCADVTHAVPRAAFLEYILLMRDDFSC